MSENNMETEAIACLQNMSQRGKGIRVAMIDGGIDCSHKNFSSAQIEDSANACAQPTEHGTAVADIILQIASDCKLIPIAIFKSHHGVDVKGCSERLLAKGIEQAISSQCDVINISGAALSHNGLGDSALREAVRKCQEADILVVAAIGNEGSNCESVPAALPSVLAVGACDLHGMPMGFNNHGHKLRKKTLLAPGFEIDIAKSGGGKSKVTGNSFSAPIVTGIATLLKSILKQRGNDHDPETLINWLTNTVQRCNSKSEDCQKVMAGRLSPMNLLKQLLKKFPTLTASNKPYDNQRRKHRMQEIHIEHNEPLDTSEEKNLADTSDSSMEVGPAAISEDPKSLNSGGIDLPSISDPAPKNNVHAKELQTTTVKPQSCNPCSEQEGEKVFIIGTLGYDFGTEARLDYFTQTMSQADLHPYDPEHMSKHLNIGENMEQTLAMIWTLKIDGIPVYAIHPDNQFAVLQYARLTKFLSDQEINGVERISIAGVITGEERLFNGQVVPRISPVLRGMFNWKTNDLVGLQNSTSPGKSQDTRSEELHNFLNRIYYELRNKGNTSKERAINYTAVNAYQMNEVFSDAISEDLFLNRISAEASPICRPDSDCWDVILEFFNPKERLNAAKKLYRYTIDVSDIMPVTVGDMRSWRAY